MVETDQGVMKENLEVHRSREVLGNLEARLLDVRRVEADLLLVVVLVIIRRRLTEEINKGYINLF